MEEVGREEIYRLFVTRQTYDMTLRLPASILDRRPWLQLLVGTYLALRGHADQSAPYLEGAYAQFAASNDARGELEVLTTEVARSGGLIAPEKLALLDSKFDESPELFRPGQIVMLHVTHEWRFDDWSKATHHLHAAMRTAQASDDIGALMTFAAAFGPELLFNDRGMSACEQFFSLALNRVQPGQLILQRFLEAGLAYIRFYQGRLDEAAALIHPLDQLLARIGGTAWIDAHFIWLHLTLLSIHGELGRFEQLMPAYLARLRQNRVNAEYVVGVHYLHGHLLWQLGRHDALEGAIAEVEKETTVMSGHYFGPDLQRQLLLGRRELARRHFEAAESHFSQAATIHAPLRHTTMVHDPRVALALTYHLWGEEEAALETLGAIATYAGRRNMPGILAQEGTPIIPLLAFATRRGVEPEILRSVLATLRRAARERPLPIPNSPDSLTPREAQVLQLVATGVTNADIATELVITVRTVKAHVSNVLRKLDVSTRTEAVNRARKLKLL